ncbi:hypothetical protein F4859DRAFT_464954 [Xylaria cf. heliscus]|nr:hypothetical protein F4859DRAFT_464954 [Xylaria cf. heliscus]
MDVTGVVTKVATLLNEFSNIIIKLRWCRSTTELHSALSLLTNLTVSIDQSISELESGANVNDTTKQLLDEYKGAKKLIDEIAKEYGESTKYNTRFRRFLAVHNTDKLKEIIDKLESHRANIQRIIQLSIEKPTAEARQRLQETLERYDEDTQRTYQDLTDLRHVPQDQILDQAAAADQLRIRTETGIREIGAAPGKTNEQQILKKIQESLLNWLSFAAMNRRLEEISQSYGSTFEWIFDPDLRDDNCSNFCKWLGEPRSGLYWVRGREGSGKSTLMKYIWQSPKTREYLKTWQDSSELCTAAFSLWKVGNNLAKSQAGLLRSLLYTLLSQKPDLVSLAFSRQWSLLYRAMNDAAQQPCNLTPPSVSELVLALKRLINSRGGSLKIFLVLDGLDENEGDSNAIVDLCKDIASSTNVKVVCSSRESGYGVFIQAFSRRPTLQLEKMNRKDIEAFVKGSLESVTPSVINVTDRAALAQAVTEKSQGLFIWASLATTSLIQGLQGGKSLVELQELLRTTPAELGSLYNQLFRSLPPEGKQYVSKILQILLEWSRVQTIYTSESEGLDSIPLQDLCLANGKIIEVFPGGSPSKDDITVRCNIMEMNLQKHCFDFIEVRRGGRTDAAQSQRRVEFSHRTVLDHFQRHRSCLSKFTKEMDLNPSLSLLKSVVHRLQILNVPKSRKVIWGFAVAAFVYANHVESVLAGRHNSDGTDEINAADDELDGAHDNPNEVEPEDPEAETVRKAKEAERDARHYIRLLTELDKSMQRHHEKLLKAGDDWTTRTYLLGSRTRNDKGWQSRKLARVHWSNFHPTTSQPLSWKSDFLSVTAQFGLLRYLSHRLDEDNKLVRVKKGRPILEYALCPLDALNHDLVTVEVVQKLLDHGARPEYRFQGRTSWQSVLAWENTYPETLAGNTSRAKLRLKIFLLLLQKGADPHARYSIDTGDISFEEFLDKHFPDHQEAEDQWADLRAIREIVSTANDKRESSWQLPWAR